MKVQCKFVLFLILTCCLPAAPQSSPESLPEAVSNNAVATMRVKGQIQLFSIMGLGAKKDWNSASNQAYLIDVDSGKASTIHPVPGTAGRIGAAAAGVGNYLFLFGGYVLYQGGGMA